MKLLMLCLIQDNINSINVKLLMLYLIQDNINLYQYEVVDAVFNTR